MGQLWPIFAPTVLYFLISSFFVHAIPSACTTSLWQGKFYFSFMTEFRHHFLQKAPFPTPPPNQPGQAFSFYILVASHTCNYLCICYITQILFLHLPVSPTRWDISGGPCLCHINLQIPSIKDEIWKDSKLLNSTKLMSPCVMVTTPILLCFAKFCIYPNKLHLLLNSHALHFY